ncbi:MAG: hypothetical protein WA655_13315 [Candidatus Korobacteraceae bacterium]
MERVDDNAKLELLRRANARFGQFFQRFSGAPVLGTEEEVDALRQMEQTLKSVGALLDGRLQSSTDGAVRQELARYRENLIQLRNQLASMQESAEGCRTRLYYRQKHLHAAKAWCAASRATT